MSEQLGSSDSLFPGSSTLPLCELGGGNRPVANVPGVVRPFAATLGELPIELGKHDTTASRWTTTERTKQNLDNKEVPDTVQKVNTDT